MTNSNRKCSFVAVVGVPNAGKSTLVNTIVGEKISIVSHKIQTTRRQIRGIVELGETQVIFIDTPGFCKADSPLEKMLMKNFNASYKGSDLILLVLDATSKNDKISFDFIEKLAKTETPLLIAINKVDIAKREDILKIANTLSKYDFIKKVFMISALQNDGIDDLKMLIEKTAPIGPWLFEKEKTTDSDVKFRLQEITREKIFNKLEKELPYSIYVETELFHESEKKAKICQSIVVMKNSQKGIVLGHSGTMIKSIKEDAIIDMRNLLGKKIELRLFVKVKEKWTEKKIHLQNAGITL